MAKKVVATLQAAGKDYAKVISVVRSKKTGSYTFKEEIMLNEKAQELVKKG